MPILSEEPSLYPEQLLEDFTDLDYPGGERGDLKSPGCEDHSWWVLMTKPRQEKAVARQLYAQDIPFYLPLVRKDNRIRGRRVSSHIPLFTGYIFLFGNDEHRVSALQTNRISQTLLVPDQPRLWRDLQQINRLIEANAPLTVESRLQKGQRVRISSGPLMGMEGTVSDRRARARLLVAVHFLQSGVSVEIDDYMLEPIG